MRHVHGGRLSRRTLLLGGASFAAGATFGSGEGQAAASVAEGEWTLGHVSAMRSANVVEVAPLQTDTRVVVVLAPDADVRASLAPGAAVVIEGQAGGGTINASRVVRGVFGTKPDATR
jgi:hypothetical protein